MSAKSWIDLEKWWDMYIKFVVPTWWKWPRYLRAMRARNYLFWKQIPNFFRNFRPILNNFVPFLNIFVPLLKKNFPRFFKFVSFCLKKFVPFFFTIFAPIFPKFCTIFQNFCHILSKMSQFQKCILKKKFPVLFEIFVPS